MRSLYTVVILTILAIVSACHTPSPTPVTTTPTPTRTMAQATADPSGCEGLSPPLDALFPSDFDYPQNNDSIKKWGDAGPPGHRQRFHAYCVFAGLNFVPRDSTIPVWKRWKTTTQAFAYQYNKWPTLSTGSGNVPEGTARERTVPINHARARASGPQGTIVNPAPVYYVNANIANNDRYRRAGCLQAVKNTDDQIVGYTLRDGKVFQSNGDIMVSSVSYSPYALNSILNQNLYNAAVLDQKLPSRRGDPATIKAMHPLSIALKVMLWPVSGNSATALPIWYWDKHAPGSSFDHQYAGYEMNKVWTDAVAINGSGAKQDVTFLYGVLDPTGNHPLGPNTYTGAQVVGLGDFYSQTYSAADLASLSPCDEAILDASAYWAYNRSFQAGDSLAMVAMHIMTKEQDAWTFQSAWWHPEAAACTGPNARFCGHRPDTVRGGDTKWKNYMMTTTYGQYEQESNRHYYKPPGTKTPTKLWPVAYNPYIELAASHPITTNCINCHQRAAWPPNTQILASKIDPRDKTLHSAYLQAPKVSENPNVLESFAPLDKQTSYGVFDGLVMLDAMWAVSDRAGYPVPPPAASNNPGVSKAPETSKAPR